MSQRGRGRGTASHRTQKGETEASQKRAGDSFCIRKLLCFTDGVVELESNDDPDFGQNVVKKCVAEATDIKTTIASIIQSLDIQRSNTKLFDDITLLGIDFYANC